MYYNKNNIIINIFLQIKFYKQTRLKNMLNIHTIHDTFIRIFAQLQFDRQLFDRRTWGAWGPIGCALFSNAPSNALEPTFSP